jgi:hypothetical protein
MRGEKEGSDEKPMVEHQIRRVPRGAASRARGV